MKKVAVGGMLVGLAFIIAGAFWLAYRNSVENDIVADQTAVQSPVVKTDQEAPTAKQGAQDSPTEAAEGEAEAAANGEIVLSSEASVAYLDLMELPPALRVPVPDGYERYGKIGYTRQGNPYRINPDWADLPPEIDNRSGSARAWAATPTGPPIEHDWTGDYWIAVVKADWSDPRTWESYRNFWGFDRPRGRGNGTFPYQACLDNWGTPLQFFDGEGLVDRYGKTKGFRPFPEQMDRFLNLEEDWRRAYRNKDAASVTKLRQEMDALINSAQGDVPVIHTIQIVGYSTDTTPTSDEQEKAQTARAIRNLYIRMGIGHLYEFYGTSKYNIPRRNAGL